MFIKYPKIHRLGVDENDGILLGDCFIQEKVDGANTSIWLEDGEIKMASRNKEITEGFNGFCDYVLVQMGVSRLLKDHPEYRLYGEWLVRHSISYNETSYKKWYLFDVWDGDRRLAPDEVFATAKEYGIDTPEIFAKLTNPKLDEINEYVGKSTLGEKGEGVVIKNMDFINKFGDLEYAKVVTQEFKEDNATIFGGNNKHSDTYWEQWVVNKFINVERVRKIMHKIQPEIDKRLNIEHTARIINTAYHDMITEEIWEIQKKVQTMNFRHLARLAQRKASMIYQDILNDDLSVAYN